MARKPVRTRSARRSRGSATERPAGAEGAAQSAGTPRASLLDSLSGLTSSALRLASLTGQSAARAVARSPEQLRMMANAGESLRDLRTVTGMTANEIAAALKLRDRSVWEAIEDGREALSFELILRLASLVARNDPLPFVLKYTRTYHPRLWEVLREIGLDQLPIQFGRERDFLNVYRRHDAARKLSDAGFEKVLEFTRQAFELALHFIAAQENVSDDEPAPEEDPPRRRRAKASRR